MIDEEEKQKYIEATKCDSCKQWHKHCDSECCKSIFLNINPDELKSSSKYFIINPGKNFTFADARYYKLHGVEYIRGLLRFNKDNIEVIGRNVIYFKDCSRLKNNLCLDHPDLKPEVCKILTLQTSKISHPSFKLTPNCLFKYKCKEVKKDD